jgi:hypothetical protein
MKKNYPIDYLDLAHTCIKIYEDGQFEEKINRYGPWLFQSLWVPGSLSITNENASGWPVDEDSAIMHDLLGRTARPSHLRSVQLKYNLSDLQFALNKAPVLFPVTGYIQSTVHRAVDRDQLLRWFPATWSPVLEKLGQNTEYHKLMLPDPEHRHVQWFCESAVAVPRQTSKIKVCLHVYPDADFPNCFTNICFTQTHAADSLISLFV